MKKEWEAKYANKKLSEDEIIAQCWVFLLAGYETTATTLAFMSHELALHPNCQQKLNEYLRSAFGPDGEISYETLHSLPYLDACISEILRPYPALPGLERESLSDFSLNYGVKEIKLTKGMLVEIPTYTPHIHIPTWSLIRY